MGLGIWCAASEAHVSIPILQTNCVTLADRLVPFTLCPSSPDQGQLYPEEVLLGERHSEQQQCRVLPRVRSSPVVVSDEDNHSSAWSSSPWLGPFGLLIHRARFSSARGRHRGLWPEQEAHRTAGPLPPQSCCPQAPSFCASSQDTHFFPLH